MADYRGLAAAAAQRHGIPTNLFMRLIQQESGWNPTIRSKAGAIGLGQLMPDTARGLGVNPLDPAQNLEGAARYLSNAYGKYKRWDLALAAYNAGGGAVDKYGGIPPYRETRNYVKTILGGKDVATEPSHTTSMPSVAQQSAPAENTHKYTDFAMGLVKSMQQKSPEAMMGAIMQLRHSLVKPNPVSSPQYGQPIPGKPVNPGMVPAGGNPLQEMIAAEKLAKQMGMRYTENYNLPGGVAPGVHTPTSYHYRKYAGQNVGRALDVSGNPAQMAAYYRRLSRTNPTELFYDPLGGMKYGKNIGAIGGHSDHVHIAY